MGIVNVSTSTERLAGYMRALQENSLEVNKNYIYKGLSQYDDGMIGTEQLLTPQTGITAIFTTNNLMTLGALHAIRKLGLRCPEDVGLVGFDDHDWADIFTPPLTVVWQPTYEIGRTAAMLLEKMMGGSETRPASQTLQARLIVRGTCSVACYKKLLAP